MTATQHSTTAAAHRVGDWVQIDRDGLTATGRISSIHRRTDGVEYVVSLVAADGGLGTVVNVCTPPGRAPVLRPAHTRGTLR